MSCTRSLAALLAFLDFEEAYLKDLEVMSLLLSYVHILLRFYLLVSHIFLFLQIFF